MRRSVLGRLDNEPGRKHERVRLVRVQRGAPRVQREPVLAKGGDFVRGLPQDHLFAGDGIPRVLAVVLLDRGAEPGWPKREVNRAQP